MRDEVNDFTLIPEHQRYNSSIHNPNKRITKLSTEHPLLTHEHCNFPPLKQSKFLTDHIFDTNRLLSMKGQQNRQNNINPMDANQPSMSVS